MNSLNLPSSLEACLYMRIDNFKLDDMLTNYYKNTKIVSIDKTTEGQACTCEIGINVFKMSMCHWQYVQISVARKF